MPSRVSHRYDPYNLARGQDNSRTFTKTKFSGWYPSRVRHVTASSSNGDLGRYKEINKRIIAAGNALKRGDARPWVNICTYELENFDHVNSITALYQAAIQCKPRETQRFRKDNSLHINNLLIKIEREIYSANSRNIANPIYACAKLGVNLKDEHASFLRKLFLSINNKLEEFKPRDLANTAWAFATLGIRNDDLMDKIAGEAKEKIGGFTPLDLASTAWAFATLGIRNDVLMDKIAEEAIRKIREFNPQDLANTAWAFATLGIRNDALMNAIAGEAKEKIREFNPQELANTAWAFVTLEIRKDVLMDKIAEEAIRKIGGFNPQNLANTAWAFGSLGIGNDDLMDAIAEEAKEKIGGFNPQGLANTAWAFATLGIRNDALMNKIAKESVTKIGRFNSQGLINTAWAFATLGIRNDALMNKIAGEAKEKITEFKPQNLANTAWAFAQLQIDDKETQDLLEAIETEALKTDERGTQKIDRFNAIELAQLSFAVSRLCLNRPKFMLEIAKQIKTKKAHFLIRSLAECGRNFTIFYNLCDTSFRSPSTPSEHNFLQEILSEIISRKSFLSVEDSTRIHTILLYLELACGYFLTPSLQSLKKRTEEMIVKNAPLSSATHMAVHNYFERLFSKKLKREVSVAGFFLDTVLDEAHKIVVDVDGPCHFLTSGNRRGETQLKDCLLKLKGWTNISVNVIDWDHYLLAELHMRGAWAGLYLVECIKTLPRDKREYIRNQLPSEYAGYLV